MEEISIQYPQWYLILCLALGAGCAVLVYFKTSAFADKSVWLRGVMAVLRGTLVSLLAILLLSPLLKLLTSEKKDPVIVVLQDGSASMTTDKGINTGESLKLLSDRLSEKYQLASYAFGAEVSEGLVDSFEEKTTNLERSLRFVFDNYGDQNVGAVILASDGIYNEGRNPIYLGNTFTAPIHTIAYGDTTLRKDLALKNVFCNKIAYLGDKFDAQVDIQALACGNQASAISLHEVIDGKKVLKDRKPFTVNGSNYFNTFSFVLEPNRVGLNEFVVSLDKVSGEENTSNNIKSFFVEVIDARQKILILAAAPHPDISALRQLITNNKNYEVEVAYAPAQSVDVGQYDLAILHNLPSSKHKVLNILNQLDYQKIPRFLILGTQTDLNLFNSAQANVSVKGNSKANNEVQALINPDFRLFTLSDNLRNQISSFPPLNARFGEFVESPTAKSFLYQTIGKIKTKYPLLLFSDVNGLRTAVLCGDGIWKWKVYEFLQSESNDIVSELVNKTIQYTTVKDDKRSFRVNTSKNLYAENESVFFEAQLFNQAFERINEAELTLTITSDNGNSFDFVFNRKEDYYILDAGLLDPGNYRYQASTSHDGKQHKENGKFSVQKIDLESFETTAKHDVLYNLSDKYGGQLFYPDQIQALGDSLLLSASIKPVIYERNSTMSVMKVWWLMAILLFIMIAEWFLRRYFGSY